MRFPIPLDTPGWSIVDISDSRPQGDPAPPRRPDHTDVIVRLREVAEALEYDFDPDLKREGMVVLAVAELLGAHDEEAITLDEWTPVRTLVETVLAESGQPGAFQPRQP